MTPRQGFIAACIEMVEIDDELTIEELGISQELLRKQGITDAEFDEVMNLDETETTEEKILSAIKGLDDKSKKQLVESLRSISIVDGTDSDEFEFLQRVEETLNLPVDK
jgi:hypothetical protein